MKLRSLCVSAMVPLMLLSVSGCKKETKKARERSVRVTVQQLEKRTFREQLPLQGTVQPVQFATISAKLGGTLEKLNVQAGDICRKGDVLFIIDRKILENQVVVKKHEIKVRQAALTSSEHAQATATIKLEQAIRDHKRARDMGRATSKSNLEAAETAEKTAQMAVKDAEAAVIYARAQLEQAESNLAIAEKNLDDSTTIAPFDCVVFDKFVEEKEFVSTGKNILRLENINSLEVVCFISAVYYNQIVPGETAVDFTAGGKVLARSKVTYKAPGIDTVTRTFKIKAEVPENISVVSGMLCELNIILNEKNAYGLPVDATLLRANNRYIAYTVDKDNRAESVEVKRGIIDGNYCEILNAADIQGKRFVITGQTFINNGSLLKEIER